MIQYAEVIAFALCSPLGRWLLDVRLRGHDSVVTDSSVLKSAGVYCSGMDPASLITALVGSQTGMLQLAVAARLTRMDNQDSGASVAKLIDAAQQNFNSLANVPAGIGSNLDVSA